MRSADLRSAVPQASGRRTQGKFYRPNASRPADQRSALQQTGGLRYAKDKRALLAEADRCLFQSKSEGKNRITFTDLEEAA